MKVSVVVATHAMARFDDFREAVESVLDQTLVATVVIVVVDGDEAVSDRALALFGDAEGVRLYCNDGNRGVSATRTRGAELASGEIVAFIDDDAVADPEWVAEFVRVYRESDAVAVGGRMDGEWLAGRPWYLPEEFDWLVGVTYPGFAEPGEEVRNTFESNISFRREAFLDLGGYDPELGPRGDDYSHSEGAEIGARLRAEYGRGVVYNPDAVVEHKVFERRTRLRWLLERAFEQGVSKRRMAGRSAADGSEESAYLRRLFFEALPGRVRRFVGSPSAGEFGGIAALLVLTGAVGVGYVYGALAEMG